MTNLPHKSQSSLADTIERVLRSAMRSWPRHPGSGRALRPEEFHPVAAAALAAQIETYKADPQVIKRFLQKDVGIKNVDADHVEAFWSLMRGLRKEPFAVDSRFRNTATTLEYLREEVPRRRRKIRKQRDYADRKYVVTVDMRKIHPTDIPNLPDKRVNGKYTPKEPRDPSREIEELVKWWSEETTEQFLRDARRVLPSQQYQVIRLRAQGKENKNVAQGLRIKESTVRDHVAAARRNERLLEIARRYALGGRNFD